MICVSRESGGLDGLRWFRLNYSRAKNPSQVRDSVLHTLIICVEFHRLVTRNFGLPETIQPNAILVISFINIALVYWFRIWIEYPYNDKRSNYCTRLPDIILKIINFKKTPAVVITVTRSIEKRQEVVSRLL